MAPSEKPQKSVGQRMGIAAVILSVSILLSRVLGFARESVIAYFHGATSATDAYHAAFTLPEMMNYFLAGGTLSITFIPLFSAFATRGDDEGAWKLFSTTASTMGVGLVLVTVLAEIFAPWLVPLVAPGFDDPQIQGLTITMTRIVLPAQLCFFFGGLISATLFVREVFWPSAIAPLVYNLCIILGGVLLDPWLGIQGFSVGVVVGALLGPLGVPLWAARRHVKFRFRFAPRDPGFKEYVLLTLPLMLGVGLVTVDEWLLKFFGSMQEGGAITWLMNSRKLMLVVFAVIGQAAGQAALPYLSRLFEEGDEEAMGRMLAESLQRVIFLALVGAAGLIAAAGPIVFVVYRRGEFSMGDAQMTSTLLVIFALGLGAWAAQTLAARGFYARKDTLTPMIVGTVTVGLALPMYWFFNAQYGVIGLAAATSIGMTLNATGTIVVYRWRNGALPLRPLALGMARGAIFGAVCAAAAWGTGYGLARIVDLTTMWANVGALVLMGVAFAVAAVLMSFLMSPPELEFALSRIRRKLPFGRRD